MTIRDTIMAAVLTAALGTPGALAAQGLSPDSLARLGLPADPNDFVRRVAAGEEPLTGRLLSAGCPSEGGWAGAAFAAMTEAAETDPRVQGKLAWKLGAELQRARDLEHGRRNPHPRCPSEHPRFEAWLAEQLRREWERGLLAGVPVRVSAHPPGSGLQDSVTVLGPGESKVVGTLLRAIVAGTEASTRELVRDIARDPEVWEPWREDAADRLAFLYFGTGDRNSPQVNSPKWGRYIDAYETALFDLAAGAPLPKYEREGLRIVGLVRGREAFGREYERVLRAAGREAFWK